MLSLNQSSKKDVFRVNSKICVRRAGWPSKVLGAYFLKICIECSLNCIFS